LRKVAETTKQIFITNDRPNVKGLILAGSADFKSELGNSDLFDQRLFTIIINTVDLAYGGENGLTEAIEKSKEVLGNLKFVAEKKLITEFMTEISIESGKYVFGVDETIKALEMGAIKTMIIWENLNYEKYSLVHPITGEKKELFLTPEQAKNSKHSIDKENVSYDFVHESLLDWLTENYKNHGCILEFITNKSEEGSQFVKGFGGIGAFLRYKVDIEELSNDFLKEDDKKNNEDDNEFDDLNDFM